MRTFAEILDLAAGHHGSEEVVLDLAANDHACLIPKRPHLMTVISRKWQSGVQRGV